MLNLGQIEKIKIKYLNTLMEGLLKRDMSSCVATFKIYLEGYADALGIEYESLENELDKVMLGSHDMKNEIFAHSDEELYKRVSTDLKYY